GQSPGAVSDKLLQEDAEKALHKAFTDVKKKADPLIKKGDYYKALEVIADLKSPIDGFFDGVMVMVDDEKLKNNRLALLKEIAELFEQIADFSFIGSTA
ncbi:MAG: DALR anticodon-binding domain-containing protein, partial [Deltaproteobacteria bacterium]